MPFADYADFDACVRANQDASDPDAYCAAIMRQVEGKSEEGYEFKELPDEAKSIWAGSFKESFGKNDENGSAKIAWATVLRQYEKGVNGQWSPMKVFKDIKFKTIFKEDRVIYGAASVAIVDSDNELITEDALKIAFRSYVNRGHVLFYHRNVPVGEVIPKYRASDGKEYVSEVKDGKLNIAVRLYKDTEIANDVWKAIEDGQLRAFSIGGKVKGEPVEVCPTADTCYHRIDDIDIHEVSIVPEPANGASYFGIIKSKIQEVKKESPEAEKLRKLEALILDEKNITLNCTKFTEQARKILGETNMSSKEDTIKELAERLAKLEARLKAEHQGDCPEGHHMVDGECVPLSEKESKEAKPMLEEQKKIEAVAPEKRVEPKADVPKPPVPQEPKTELESLRAQLAGLTEAFSAVQSATKEIASLKDTLIRVPGAAPEPETNAETKVSVTFDPDRKPTEYVDWAERERGASFDERLKRLTVEMGMGEVGKLESKPDETTKDFPKADIDALKDAILGMAKSVKTTMDELKAIKEKAEVDELRSQVAVLAGTIDEFRKEVSGLKDTLAIGARPAQAPAEKRTVSTEPGSAPMIDVVDWGGPGRGSFDARKRALERRYGITQ